MNNVNDMDKEQIMINGVDVSKCKYLTYELEEDGEYYWFCSIAPAGGPDECEYNPECFCKKLFKQLARKTQEYEGLKSESFTREGLITLQEKDIDRYREALEEIEKVINNILNSCLGRNTVSCRPAHNVCGDLINILDIINKAKDGN